tara:strand:- start:3742 stop:4215 length:474 start_codon:yes stop_codon:yes gene_type:complete
MHGEYETRMVSVVDITTFEKEFSSGECVHFKDDDGVVYEYYIIANHENDTVVEMGKISLNTLLELADVRSLGELKSRGSIIKVQLRPYVHSKEPMKTLYSLRPIPSLPPVAGRSYLLNGSDDKFYCVGMSRYGDWVCEADNGEIDVYQTSDFLREAG